MCYEEWQSALEVCALLEGGWHACIDAEHHFQQVEKVVCMVGVQ
jgi:hypothetical protein